MPGTVWPNGGTSKPYVSSAFGPRRAPVAGASTYHRGTDFSHTFSSIRAVSDGVVRAVGYVRNWAGGGIQVWVQHNGYFSRSLHMSRTSVAVGQSVVAGQELGIMGRTGTATDTHLHFEITPGNVHYNNSGQVDPVAFLAPRITGSGSGAGTEDDMTPEQDALLKNIAAFIYAGGTSTVNDGYVGGTGSLYNRLRNVEAHLYGGGPSATDPKYRGAPGTIYSLLKTPVVRTVNGKTTEIAQIQDNADTNTIVRDLAARPALAVTDAQVKAIADAVVKAIGTPTAVVDDATIAKITKSVNDDNARRQAN